MKKNILIIGVIFLVIGVVLSALGPQLFTTSPQKLAADRDQNGLTYNSYSKGDTVTVYGKITYVRQVLGMYTYELNGDGDSENDGDFVFSAHTDIGKVGDNVVVELELQEQGIIGINTEYWEAIGEASPVPYMLPGIMLALIGGITILVGLVKKDSMQQPVPNPQYNQQQAPPQQVAPPQGYAPQPEYYQPQEREEQGPPRF